MHEPINVSKVVRYVRNTTGKTTLTTDDGYYSSYTVPLSAVSNTISTTDVEVMLDSTTPNYGGQRYWLVCQYCHHKVTNLYFPYGTPACRHCLGLGYSSRRYWDSPIHKQFIDLEQATKLWSTRRMRYAGNLTRSGRKASKLMSNINLEGCWS